MLSCEKEGKKKKNDRKIRKEQKTVNKICFVSVYVSYEKQHNMQLKEWEKKKKNNHENDDTSN